VFGFNLGFALLLARRMGWHEAPVIYREGNSPRWNVKPSHRWGYRWVIRQADKVIAQSESIREELVQLGFPGEKIVVIPNPCRPAATRDRLPMREPKEAPLILGIGRLAPQKGFDRLIRAFAAFRMQTTNARLAILGEGPERPRLERLIRKQHLTDHVTLPGFDADLRPWYERASMLVLSSHYEGQSNALIEAILQECPVMCAAGGGATIELMQAAGLEDCLVSEDQFEQQFSDTARRVLAMADSRWCLARERLAKMTDFETIWKRYLKDSGIETTRSASTAVRA